MSSSKQNNDDSIGFPPASKRRRIDVSSSDKLELQSNLSVNSNTNVNFSNKNVISIKQECDDNHNWNTLINQTRISKISSIMETREILEHIHSFLNLEEILKSRLVCSFWNRIFRLTISESTENMNVIYFHYI